jgi:alpha-methylacyl-CoA racemase
MPSTDKAGPLAGTRVIELGGLGPGPYCAMLLADLGAEVIRIDPPSLTGKRTRHRVIHRGRLSMGLDLKNPAGAAVARRLISTADVVIEGFRPGVAERLGFSPTSLLEANPRLVYGRMTGWGQDGPLAQVAGHDLNYIALTGALYNIGPAGGPPVIPLNLVADMGGGGMMLAFGISAALLHARATGVGQVVDAAMIDGSVSQLAGILGELAGGRWTDGRVAGNGVNGSAPWYAVYRCADGGYLAIGAFEPQFYANALRVLGLDLDPLFAKQHDVSAWPAMTERLTELFATRTRDQWAALFEGVDACVTPVLSISEAAVHQHHVQRGTYVRAADGSIQPGVAPRFSATPAGVPQAPPRFGAHTREVLCELGLADADLADLVECAAISPDSLVTQRPQ